MDFGKITSVLTEHPYISGGAVILGLFLLSRGGGGSNSAGAQDMSASLASMQIASDTNVALASVQAQKDAVALGVNRDVALGAMEYAKADRQASVLYAVQALDSSRQTTESNLQTGLAAFQSALGFSAAKKDLENQRASLDNNFSLGYADIQVGKELGAASLTNARDLGIAQIFADVDVAKYSLPFQERMFNAEQATIQNLAWRQKQIAKIGANASIFGGLIGGFTDIATAGIAARAR